MTNFDDYPDLVAKWTVAFPQGLQTIEFEHGETTGKRVIRINGEEILRKDWMFSLIGTESFRVAGKLAVITIGSEGFFFKYSLKVDGKSLESFVKDINKHTRTWFPIISGNSHRIVMDTKTMDVYVNGKLTNTEGEFVENGAENHFEVKGTPMYIKTFSSGNKRKGMLYSLSVNGKELEPVVEIKSSCEEL